MLWSEGLAEYLPQCASSDHCPPGKVLHTGQAWGRKGFLPQLPMGARGLCNHPLSSSGTDPGRVARATGRIRFCRSFLYTTSSLPGKAGENRAADLIQPDLHHSSWWSWGNGFPAQTFGWLVRHINLPAPSGNAGNEEPHKAKESRKQRLQPGNPCADP